MHGKVLFLHGYTQSASIFYAKTSALRKKLLKLGYKAVYLNGPVELTPNDLPANYASQFSTVAAADGEDRSYRSWWAKIDNTNDAIHLQEAFDAIRTYIKTGQVLSERGGALSVNEQTEEERKLPVVGVVGFSQGAALAGLIANSFSELFGTDPLDFAVLYSGFGLDTSEKSGNAAYDRYWGSGKVRMLHVLGELDTVVSEERSMALYKRHEAQSEILKHPGGHFVPNSKLYVDQVCNWIQGAQKEKEEKEEESLDDLLDMMDSIGRA